MFSDLQENTRIKSRGPRKVLIDGDRLFHQAILEDGLHMAWEKVLANGGSAGGDRVSLSKFQRRLRHNLQHLREDLLHGKYEPGPLRHVDIPKRSGLGTRRLSIPCIRDRIVQTAIATELMPLLDAEFEPTSFGYRKGKSVKQAVEQVRAAHNEGLNFVVDADIENFFDRIDHQLLMERFSQSVSEGVLGELVWTWLVHSAPSGRGVAQGSPISPLLANLFLDRLDELFSQRGVRLLRFADDFVILCGSKRGAEKALARVETLLSRHGLKLNHQKTRIVDFDRGFKFLGHTFVRSMVFKSVVDDWQAAYPVALLRQIAEEDERAEKQAQREDEELARKEKYGYSPGLRVLYVHSADRRLSIRNQAITVSQLVECDGEVKSEELLAIPHQDVDRIEIGRDVEINRGTIDHLLATDTPTALVNGYGQSMGWIAPDLSPHGKRHLDQARVVLDEQARVCLARTLVAGRLYNQRANLRRLMAGQSHPPGPVRNALIVLNKTLGRNRKGPLYGANSVDQLLGHEGQATATWWRAINSLLPFEFSFESRSKPSANDPANICLNFLSSLLARDVGVAVQRAGLHPGFGVLHGTANHHDGCVYDLMEEFRSQFMGSLLVYCVNRNIVTRDMFSEFEGRVRLSSKGVRALIRAYENRVDNKIISPRHGRRITWRRLMVEQAFALAVHFEGEQEYQPYRLSY